MNSEVLGGAGKPPALQNNGCCGRGTPRRVFYSHFLPTKHTEGPVWRKPGNKQLASHARAFEV